MSRRTPAQYPEIPGERVREREVIVERRNRSRSRSRDRDPVIQREALLRESERYLQPDTGAETQIEPTISDDRSHGSAFESKGEIWTALASSREPALPSSTGGPQLREPVPGRAVVPGLPRAQTFSRVPEKNNKIYTEDDVTFSRFPEEEDIVVRRRTARSPREDPRSSAMRREVEPMDESRPVGRTASRYYEDEDDVRYRATMHDSRPFPPRNRVPSHYPDSVYDALPPDNNIWQRTSTAKPGPDTINHMHEPSGHSADEVDRHHTPDSLSSTEGYAGDEFGPSRDKLARLLGIPEQASSSLASMQAYIADLRRRSGQPKPLKSPRHLTIYRIIDSVINESWTYLDEPQWIEGADGLGDTLKGALPLSNVRSYLQRHPEVCFIACRDYIDPWRDETEDPDFNGNARVAHDAETIIPVEENLALAIRKFTAYSSGIAVPEPDDYDDGRSDLGDFTNDWVNRRDETTLSSPYLPLYHARDTNMGRFERMLNEHQLWRFRRVIAYVKQTCSQEYQEVDRLLAKGNISPRYLKYLFKPGTVVVQGDGDDARGYLCTSWLQEVDSEGPGSKKRRDHQVDAWSWSIGRQFYAEDTKLELPYAALHDCVEKPIRDLPLRPLAHVDAATAKRLRTRGQWVWKCRVRQMVSCSTQAAKEFHHAVGERYMIDTTTYYEIHPENTPKLPRLTFRSRAQSRVIDAAAMKRDDPPDEDFVYLTPKSMRGFNLKTKKWCDLEIDKFNEISWNMNAFKSLVLNEKTKRLIQALISNQIEAEMSTDIISGKGNGLLMLLHGGPGTGKTLTAESVAEIAQRPLFPVTCGDMGVEPRAVEKYLESVLHLGKTWGCVVLLDEADVFLEQRSLEDLNRNALVSVFLRVLEYYDGILVLTSNRVGTFDEAFKSRIQLAIHYTSLTTHQRTKVWGNFFGRLKQLNEEGIDFVDLEDNIEHLARHKMNGREIRNVITTARQYARWERKQQGAAGSGRQVYLLNYKVLEEIIETSGQFDKYIALLNGGLSQDQLAEDEGIRLAGTAVS